MDSYHFIGIGGIGMSALAHILKDQGHNVSGSDEKSSFITKQLEDKGIPFFLGHTPMNIPKGSTIIYSSGIRKENSELKFSRIQNFPLKHRSELLSQLLEGKQSILIAGSHGKTTSAALLVFILKQSGEPLTFAIGGLSDGMNGQYNSISQIFIAEADESDGSLINYFPTGSIITNIDNEHLDHYLSLENLYATFNKYVDQVKKTNLLFYNGDTDLSVKVPYLKKGISFGFSPRCDLQILSYRQEKWNSIFSIKFQGRIISDICVSLTGEHNILNAAAVFGMSLNLGVSEKDIRLGMQSFVGVKRRLEKKRDDEYLITIDDYAHHPKEIYSTLQGLRNAVGNRRIIAVCQPHRYSRVKICQEEYADAFLHADVVIITDIYSPNEKDEWMNCVDIETLVRDIKEKIDQEVFYIPFSKVSNFLKEIIQIHDVIVSLGAGNINKIHNELINFTPNKLNVALVFGGKSCEHTISLLSSRFFNKFLNKDLYSISYFGINKKGKWIIGKRAQELLEDETSLEIPITEGMAIFNSSVIDAMQDVSIFCPILHGSYGEDGSLQGFFEILNKPYTGPNVCFSAISMNKIIAKRLAQSIGIPVVPWLDLTEEQWLKDQEKIIEIILNRFSFPFFVKSSNLGSSLGIFLVNNDGELKRTLKKAFLLNNQIIIEESRLGSREIEFSILGNSRSSFVIEASPSERLGQGEFINYYSKYGLKGHVGVSSSNQLKLDMKVISEGLHFARRIYDAMEGNGCARVDFFLDKNNKFWFSEINSIPGMTSSSPFPLSLEKKGITHANLCQELIINGLHNHRIRERKYKKQAQIKI